MARCPSATFVMWQEFCRLEAERIEKEYGPPKTNGKPEPVRDMAELRKELHREHG